MKRQQQKHPQEAWERNRNPGGTPRGGQGPDYGPSQQRMGSPAQGGQDYPEPQHHAAAGEPPGMRYHGSTGGYGGGRGEYPRQEEGGAAYRAPGAYAPAQESAYGSSYGAAPGGGYGQQEAFQPARQGYGEEGGGRYGGQPGQYGPPGGPGQYGQEDFGQGGFGPGGYGGYGREEEQHYGQGRPSPVESYRPLPGEGRSYEQGGRQQQGFGWGEQSYGRHQRFEGGQGSFQGGQLPSEFGFSEIGHEVGGYGAYHQGGWIGQSDLSRERKGPKHYERSDERIREFICERLAQCPSLDVEEVSVEVSGACVTLEGTVPARRMKHLIEDLADSCWGVREVDNRIKVRPGREASPSATAAGLPEAGTGQEPGTPAPGKRKETGL